MDCVNHPGVSATSYCQNCGKALCTNCVCTAAGGQLFCQPCFTAWQSFQQPFAGPPVTGAPNPTAAAVLGLIPGVGAMYNGQFFKGLIHVVIFAVLISIADHYGIFGIFIAAWVLYQSFEAFHTAKARRDGQPLPDPLGLNEVGNWLNLGGNQHWQNPNPPTGGPIPPNPGAGPYTSTPPSGQGPATGGSSYQPPYTGGTYQTPYQGYQPPYQTPYTPPGYTDPGIPPIPPVPPRPWRRREPVGAVILIALGVLFLLGQMDIFSGHLFQYSWPLLLIGLGAWMVVRRLGDSQGGPK